jgi:hypothetical protein
MMSVLSGLACGALCAAIQGRHLRATSQPLGARVQAGDGW